MGSPLQPGDSFALEKYKVKKSIGQGSYGEVYLVTNTALDREEALKVLEDQDEFEQVRSLLSEARISLRFRGNPNIVEVYDANWVTPYPGCYRAYFTMEYFSEGSLAKYLATCCDRQLGPSAEETVSIVKQICRGLSPFHAANPQIVHRDIKPHNILIDTKVWRFCVSDFGIAKAVDLSGVASVAGNRRYKPPEAWEENPNLSPAADVWAVGCICYELLTLKFPFRLRKSGEPAFDEALKPASEANPTVDKSLDDIIAKALCVDRDQRYQTAKELLANLERWKPDAKRAGHETDDISFPGRDIFLSYSVKDNTIVQLALEKLEAAGLRCWFAPRDIPIGEFYAGQVIQALRESRFVLLFFSGHSNASEQVVREINFAVRQRLPMLVVRLDQTALNNDFEYLIRINQWLDLTYLASDAERVAEIVARVHAALAKSGPKTSTVKAPVAMTFGDFEILADSSGKPIELGRGGMGVTYRARQMSMGGRAVALKVIQPELLGDDNVRRRFLREAQLAGEIDHENVALVYLRGQEGDSYFYAMQLVEGVDLDRYVKANGPLAVRDGLSVTAQVASALTAANSKGLIHRDIKPSNLMAVRRRNILRIKLIDFGLAKQITQQDIHNSLSGKDEFKGTLAYASPEQCQAFPLDTRSDLYSLGVTLWFLLSGKVPFAGNLAAVSGAHVWAPLPLQQLPTLPQAVLELLQSLLAKNPADRPQTPGEVEDRAEALLRSLPSDLVSDSAAVQGQPATSGEASPQPEENSTLVGAPVLTSYLQPAIGQIREDRFELVESLPEGGSGRLFRARERRGSDWRIVAIKFLHPSICAEEESAESFKAQFAALQKVTLDHLLRYFALELGSKPPFLVREWVQGVPLTGVLRLKAGALTPPEVSALFEPLPGLLEALASSGLSLIALRLSKLWARLPPDLEPAKFGSWVKQATAQDWRSRLALDPLSLRGLVSRSVQSESDVTLLPTSRSLALQQNRAGIQGRTPAQLLASVVYELLSGQPPQTDSYRPLAAIPDGANQRLKQALTYQAPDQSSASELWLALKTDFPQAPKVPTPTRRPEPDAGPNIGRSPPTKPQPPPAPDTTGPQRTNWTRLWLILGSFAVFTSIILLASWLSSHRSPSQPSPTPAPEPSQPPPTATGAEHFIPGVVPPLPIAIGDPLEMVRTALKTTQEGKPYSTGTNKDGWELDLPDKGLMIFFDDHRKVYTIRFDAPFSGSIFGVTIGDSRASVVKRLGQPLRSWSDDTRVYYENKVSIDYGQSNTVETMFK